MEYQQRALRTQQQQRAAAGGLARAPASATGSRYPAMAHGHPLPPHAPMLSTGELSGETTCVDHTDYSDNGLPPHRVLSRDESGSSWWSLDDQGGAGAAVSARLSGVPSPIPSSSWPQREHHGSHHHQGGNNDFSSGAGDEHYGQRTGLWGGLRPGSAAGTGSGSGGSTGESWDDESEEGQGQDEEEVAALLLGLGRTTNEDFEGFSDVDEERAPERPVRPGGVGMFREAPRHRPVSNASQELSV